MIFTDTLYVIVALVLGLGLLVLVHEWGHFIVARWAGVRVETFSIGFGRKIAAFRRGETEYMIGWIPLGGYVKMTGQEDMGAAEQTDDPASYANKPVHKRIAIVLAEYSARVSRHATHLLYRSRTASL
jgi:regulator of sigma E protease